MISFHGVTVRYLHHVRIKDETDAVELSECTKYENTNTVM